MANSEKRKGKKKTDRKKLFIRIIAWLLIIMTVVTTMYTVIYFLIMQVSAADTEDLSVAVGLLYGNSCDVAFTTTTTTGYTVGSETVGKYTKNFEAIWSLPDVPKVTVLGDRNFGKKSTGSYYQTDEDVLVGGYHVEFDDFFQTESEALAEADLVNTVLSFCGSSLYAIPSYINGVYKIRLGSYKTEAEAFDSISEIAIMFPDYAMHTVAPSATGTTIAEHSTGKILFEYDCGTETYLALEPIDNSDGTEAYLATYAGNLYDGVFVYRRYISGTKDGIELINVLDLEDYIMGVVPYEVSNSWPKETLKAFAVVARTYVVSSMNKYWPTNGFNVCATANSQVYKGVARVNSNVEAAVNETAGMVMSYNGSLAPVYYSSSMGNCTADVKYVWGGTKYAWLSSVLTPWEDYQNHSNAFWKVEVSPSELTAYLNERGYTSLTSPINSITIDENAGENSSYVYKVTITDEEGNSVTVTRADKVKSAFAKYLNSSNFVVGKGSVDYTVYTSLMPPLNSVKYKTEFTYETFFKELSSDGVFSVITNSGKYSSSFENKTYVVTKGGVPSFSPDENVTVMTATSEKKTTAVGSVNGTEYDLNDFIKTETAYAENSENFIFVGKGWGHGVGISQWGLYDLAGMGFDYLNMLTAYCPMTTVSDYKTIVTY